MASHAPSRDGRQARWEKHNAERKQQILDAAVAVLESQPPGTEFHVHEIAHRAGLNRTVVYRHFSDRADLDIAIQERIVSEVAALMLPEVSLEGSVNQIVGRIVSTYVDWVVAHPSLHRFAEGGNAGPFQQGIGQIADMVTQAMQLAVSLLGAELDDDERAALDPLAHGLVGAVLGAVRRWVSLPVPQPDAARLAELLSESVWHLLDGHARRLGLEIDPDEPLLSLVGDGATVGEL